MLFSSLRQRPFLSILCRGKTMDSRVDPCLAGRYLAGAALDVLENETWKPILALSGSSSIPLRHFHGYWLLPISQDTKKRNSPMSKSIGRQTTGATDTFSSP